MRASKSNHAMRSGVVGIQAVPLDAVLSEFVTASRAAESPNHNQGFRSGCRSWYA